MDQPQSHRRLAENEVYLRQKNRAIEEQFKNIKQIATIDSQIDFIDDKDIELQFFCECSDENCKQRIPLKRSQYDTIHKANDMFVIISGHEVPEIERVIEKNRDYCIVQKMIEPPPVAFELNSTPIKNV